MVASVMAWLSTSRRRYSLVVLAVAVLVITVYGLTAAPSLTWSHWGSDGGDFVTSAVTGRVAHPPGFPLYFLLSRMLVMVVRRDPARVLNLFSSAMGAGAVLGVVAALRRWGFSWWGTVGASLTLAFAPWFWSQALITEVYTLAACLTSVVLWSLTWAEGTGTKLAYGLVGLTVGLAASVHPTVILLMTLLLPFRHIRWWALLSGVGVGLLPYTVLPLLGPWPQPWGDLRFFSGWWRYVTARLYWGNAFALPLYRWPERLLAWAVLLVRQFTPVGALLTLYGFRQLWIQRRSWAQGILLAVGLISLYAVGYHTVDSWVYLVAFLPLLAVPLGVGIDWFVARGLPGGLSLLVPVALIVANGSSVTLRGDWQAVQWLATTLDQLPAGAVVLTDRDDHTFALWYATEATTTAVTPRPDVLVIDARFWGYGPYQTFLEGRAGRSADRPEDLAHTRPFCKIELERVICP